MSAAEVREIADCYSLDENLAGIGEYAARLKQQSVDLDDGRNILHKDAYTLVLKFLSLFVTSTDWTPPFAGFFLYYPNRKQLPPPWRRSSTSREDACLTP